MAYNVEWPNAEFHEVLPNLYLGGHVWEEDRRIKLAKDSSVSSDESWDYVVSAFLEEDPECVPRCDTRLVLFNDTEKGLSEDTWKQIKSAVDEVVFRWQAGQKVLVRCQAGYNRSGMLMSLVLMRLGFSADRAISHLRWRRGRDVLVNRVFEGYVYEREYEYARPELWTETEAWMNHLVPVAVD